MIQPALAYDLGHIVLVIPSCVANEHCVICERPVQIVRDITEGTLALGYWALRKRQQYIPVCFGAGDGDPCYEELLRREAALDALANAGART